ncbi:SDR family oxidoreductase [Hymenobacter sp. BRD128]|uniref:SDR family oxidoreductase n=1 Tax=Hymenobacter sp. BRD128 TaxID=2675878 RepID=UPI001563809D|nr:SDR family oxidoreductase [Hymenobacter sp. BRD128]QKG58628.1 SDR family oxidoreductase [Hymenobacter sp. BRD128]
MTETAAKLRNKVAVITGGSSGIGLATAQLFAEQGARVAITGRNQAALDQAVAQIGHGALAVAGDVANVADLDRLFATVHQQLGAVDVLIVNAASYVLAPLADFTESMFDRVSNVNFKGTFFTVQKALPYLRDGASVVLTSSTVAEKGVPNHAAYAATKAATRSLARSFSAELLPRRIRVNVLTPGPVDTPVFESVTASKEEAEAAKAGMGQFAPVKRVATAREIAQASLYLATDDSSFMLGSELLIDGGIRTL